MYGVAQKLIDWSINGFVPQSGIAFCHCERKSGAARDPPFFGAAQRQPLPRAAFHCECMSRSGIAWRHGLRLPLPPVHSQ